MNRLVTLCSIILFVLAFFTKTSIAQNVPSYVPTNGLKGWWSFSGNSIDSSGNGNNGTVNGATLSNDRFGNSNNAYYFNGNTDYIQTPINSISGFNLTMSVWFKNTNFSPISNGDHPSLICSRTSFNQATVIGFNEHPWLFFDLVFNTRNAVNMSMPNDNLWHQIVATYDGSFSKIYYDGVLLSTQIISFSGNIIQSNILFGLDNIQGNGNRHWIGTLDDIGIWNRALTQQEITNLYNAQIPTQNVPAYVPTNGLVGWWPFSGNVIDSSGNGNNGINNGALLVSDRFGNVNCAYSFNGSNSFINIPDPVNNSLDFLGASFSISVWVKSNQTNYMPLVNKQNLSLSNESGDYNLDINTPLGTARLAMGFGSGNGGSCESTNSISTNNWEHIVAVYNAPNSMDIYINGIHNSSVCYNCNSAPSVLLNSPQPLRFGKGWQSFFMGALDDIGIWNRALTQQEITGLYNTQLPNPVSIQQNDTTICAGQTVQLNINNNFPPNNISGFTYKGRLNGKDYYLSNSTADWYQAKLSCEQNGGYLACINNAAESNFIASFQTGYFWIGLWQNHNNPNYSEPSGGWEWVSNEPFNYLGWESGEPNDYLGNGNPEDFAVNTGLTGWNDYHNSNLKYALEKTANPIILWSTSDTSASINVIPYQTTTYYCTINDGISNYTDSVKITVANIIAKATVTNTAICPNGNTTLTASGGATYLWSNGDTSANTTVNQVGNYYVVATNQYGCSDTSNTISITQKTLPTVVKIKFNGASSVCAPGTVAYLLDMPLGSTTGFAYQWYVQGSAIPGATDSFYNANTTGSYALAVSGGSNCLKYSYPKTATIKAAPTASFAATTAITICTGGLVVLVAPSITGYTYTWLKDGAVAGTGPSKIFKLSGNYTVIAKINGCSDTASPTMPIVVNPLPVSSISALNATTFCAGDSCTLAAQPTGAMYYEWHNGNYILDTTTIPIFNIGSTATIKVLVKDANGCIGKLSSTNIKTKVNSIPLASISTNGSTTISSTGSVKLKANPAAGYTFQWFKDGNPIISATNNQYIVTNGGSYTVALTKLGCVGTSTPVIVTQTTPKEEVSTTSMGEGSFELSAYPNPVNDLLTINISGLETVDGTIIVMDYSGKLITTQLMSLSTLNLDMKEYASGVYLIRYKGKDGKVGIVKITKQ